LPSVVSASKSGATAPIGRAIVDLIPFMLGGEFATFSIGAEEPQVNGSGQKGRFFFLAARFQQLCLRFTQLPRKSHIEFGKASAPQLGLP
jgi:hypothetical protein